MGVLSENKTPLVREMAEIPQNFRYGRGITERLWHKASAENATFKPPLTSHDGGILVRKGV